MEHVTRFVCDVIKKHAPIVYFIKGGEHVFVLNLRHSVNIPRDLGPWTKHGKCSQWTESFHKWSPLIIASKLWSMVIIMHSNHHASYNRYSKNVYDYHLWSFKYILSYWPLLMILDSRESNAKTLIHVRDFGKKPKGGGKIPFDMFFSGRVIMRQTDVSKEEKWHRWERKWPKLLFPFYHQIFISTNKCSNFEKYM